MNLVVIHGPPGSGKYTIGKKLSELTGYKLFHNHLTVDVVRTLFDDEDKRRNNLLSGLRLSVIKEAARFNIDTVFTMAYTQDKRSEKFVNDFTRAVDEYNGSIHYVRLDPPDSTLYERIGNLSRKRLHKPTDPEHLRRFITEHNTRVTIDPAGLILDTSKISPDESARNIIKQFNLENE